MQSRSSSANPIPKRPLDGKIGDLPSPSCEPPRLLEFANEIEPDTSGAMEQGAGAKISDLDAASTAQTSRSTLMKFPPYDTSPESSPEDLSSNTSSTSIDTPHASGSSSEQHGAAASSSHDYFSQPQHRARKPPYGPLPPLPPMPESKTAPPAPLSASIGARGLSLLFHPPSPSSLKHATTSIPPPHGPSEPSESSESSESPGASRPTTPTPIRYHTPLIYTPPRSSSLPGRYRHVQPAQLQPPVQLQPPIGLPEPTTPPSPPRIVVTPSKLRKKSGQIYRLRSRNRLVLPPAAAASADGQVLACDSSAEAYKHVPSSTTCVETHRGEDVNGRLETPLQARHPSHYLGLDDRPVPALRAVTTPTRRRTLLDPDEGWFCRSPSAASTATTTSATASQCSNHTAVGSFTRREGSDAQRVMSRMLNGEERFSEENVGAGSEVKEPGWVTKLFRRPSTPRPRTPSIISVINSPRRHSPRPPSSPLKLKSEPSTPSRLKASLSKAKGVRLSSYRSRTPIPDLSAPFAPQIQRGNERPETPVVVAPPGRRLKTSRSKASLRSLFNLWTTEGDAEPQGSWCTECGDRCTRHSPSTQDPFANLSAPTSIPASPLAGLPSTAGAVNLHQLTAMRRLSLRETAPWGTQRSLDGGVAAESVKEAQFGSVRQRARSNSSATARTYPPYPPPYPSGHAHSLSYPPDPRRRSVSLNLSRHRSKDSGTKEGAATLCFRGYRVGPIAEQGEDSEDSEEHAADSMNTQHAYTFPRPVTARDATLASSGTSRASEATAYYTCEGYSPATSEHTGHTKSNSQGSGFSQQTAYSHNSSGHSAYSQYSYPGSLPESLPPLPSRPASGEAYTSIRSRSGSESVTHHTDGVGEVHQPLEWTLEPDRNTKEAESEVSRWSDSD